MRVNSISFSNYYKNLQNAQKINHNNTKNLQNKQINRPNSSNISFESIFKPKPFIYHIPNEKKLIKEIGIRKGSEKIITRNAVERLTRALNISDDEALDYYQNKGILIDKLIPIDPEDSTSKRTNERLVHDLRHKLILPVFYVQELPEEYIKNIQSSIPDGVILQGKDGISKKYIIDKLCENCKRFDVETIEVRLDDENHHENAKKIKKAFRQAQEHFEETGNYTFIKFSNNLDSIFVKDSLNSTYFRELAEFTEATKDSAKKGAIWVGCVDNINVVDDSLLKNKVLKTTFEDIKIDEADKIMKFCFRRYNDEKSEKGFKYETVKQFLKKYNLNFNPAEYDYFIKTALSYPKRNGVARASDVINCISEYANYRYQMNIDPNAPFMP